MKIPTESYFQKFQQYSDALNWMKTIGVQFSSSRINHYAKTIEYWKDNYEIASDLEVKKAFPSFVSSMFEINDFIEIHNAFKNEAVSNLNHIIKKLKKGVNGPIDSKDETPNSTTARNFLFEAVVAAKAHKPDKDIEAILDAHTDTGIKVDRTKIWIECKRIASEKKIKANIKKASDQITSCISRKVGSKHRGIVAIDVTKLINSENDIFVAASDSKLKSSIDQIMDTFIKDHSQVWQTLYQKKNNKVIGTIIRFSFMASSESRNLLVHSSQWGVNPCLGISEEDNRLLKAITNKMNNHSPV